LDPLLEKRFQFTWDIDPYCFHKRFVSVLMAFVKKSKNGDEKLVWDGKRVQRAERFFVLPVDQRSTA
jgi:hypothetical protein